jgi:O-antigen ligase
VIDYFIYTVEVAKDYQGENFFFGEITRALSLSPFGLGIGISTTAARHGADSVDFIDNHAFEPLLARAYAEMGLVGLMALGGLMGAIFVYCFVFLRRAKHMGTMPFVGPIAVLLLMIVCQAFKGSMIDFDPLNIFFWLLLGVMFGLRMPETARRPARGGTRSDWLHTDGQVPR